MNRNSATFKIFIEGVPRARGDEPWLLGKFTDNAECSPRPRG